MPQDLYHYEKMVENALRGVVRAALTRAAKEGLRGGHHFYISFRSRAPGVALPEFLLTKYPDEMTIVLQHQFWDLTVGEEDFSVLLSFHNQPERIVVPFAAITAFADPSVKFGLQFQAADETETPAARLPATLAPTETPAAPEEAKPDEPAERPAAEVVTLDKFRKR